MKSATDVFTQKNSSKDIFNSTICYRYDYLIIGPSVIIMQGVITLIVSSWPHASYLSNFEITCAISDGNRTEWSTIVRHEALLSISCVDNKMRETLKLKI